MSSNLLTWEEATPRRPGLNDVGGAAKVNDPIFPPNPSEHATAEDFNQISKQIVASAKVTTSARLWIKFTAGAPSVDKLYAPNGNLVIGDFTLTDNGNGDVTITVAAAKLPAIEGAHVTLWEDVEIDRVRVFSVSALAVRVKTKLGATGTDVNYIIDLF